MKYTQIPVDTFERIQLNAGILVDDFTPATGVVGNLIGATTGGINFTATNEYTDYGEDIDNCPKNMLELKKLDSIDAKMTGTFVTITADAAKSLVGAADVDADDTTHIIPRRDVKTSDFKDLWFVGDYSDVNTGDNAGFIAIHLMNTLSTGGFQIQTSDKGKGNFAFEFTAHFSMAAQDTVPYEVYVVQGSDEPTPPTPPTPTTYSVTYTLDEHVSSSNEATSVNAEAAYTTTLTAAEDYRIDTISVTMGGTDVTESAYTADTGVVSIASVTGNIVITATSTAGA